MKRALVLCVALLSLIVAAQAKDGQMGGTEREIAALEQKWVDASKAGNPDLLGPLLAFTFVRTDSDGKMTDKQQALAHVKVVKWETSEISDLKVTVYGKAAVATGIWVGKGTDADGKPIDARERWTDTWIKTYGGMWACVASHSSTIK